MLAIPNTHVKITGLSKGLETVTGTLTSFWLPVLPV